MGFVSGDGLRQTHGRELLSTPRRAVSRRRFAIPGRGQMPVQLQSRVGIIPVRFAFRPGIPITD